ncbi:MAG TPA: biotin--[acetyl-CoA-carboxylase] ligase [Vicinamibacterales bacterium]|nr:biotin--[acetyl-CoA-carboxylase] ligase [Vicinamibacterales bacterium]
MFPDTLPAELVVALAAVRPRLGRLASDLRYFPTIGSTNDVAATAPEGAVVIAEEQTAGRGRRGHGWFSPPGSGLYVSIVLAPSRSIDPRRATSLTTIAAGVALADGIEAAVGLRIRLKWPNDLYVGPRKLGGILAEASGRRGSDPGAESVVVGYGINVGEASYPPALRDRATSLESELDRMPPRAHVLAETLAALSARYDDLLAGRFDAILNGWRARANAAGAVVEWNGPDARRSGRVVDIDDDGALLVKSGGAIERIVSGELTWL